MVHLVLTAQEKVPHKGRGLEGPQMGIVVLLSLTDGEGGGGKDIDGEEVLKG